MNNNINKRNLEVIFEAVKNGLSLRSLSPDELLKVLDKALKTGYQFSAHHDCVSILGSVAADTGFALKLIDKKSRSLEICEKAAVVAEHPEDVLRDIPEEHFNNSEPLYKLCLNLSKRDDWDYIRPNFSDGFMLNHPELSSQRLNARKGF